jgi:hypothetical protein
MKKLLIASLLSAPVLTNAAPAMAQEFSASREIQTGGFAGARVRIPFGGSARREPIRAGLAFAPTVRVDHSDGRSRTRIGEGLEFGINGNEPVGLSLAGTPVSQLVQGRRGPDGQRLGVSTVGWIAIGAGAVLVLVAGFYVWLIEESKCGPGEC